MRIALLQHAGSPGDAAAQLATLERQARVAAQAGARLIVTPEMFLSGYNIGADEARRLAEPSDGAWFRRIAAMAQAIGIAVAYGYPELGADGQVYNAACLVADTGLRLLDYRKTHLWGELDRAMFAAGTANRAVAEIDGIRIGLLICYDVEFPEMVRGLALAGADLVIVPTAQMEPYEFVQRRLIAVRAFENRLFVAYANRCGREAELRYYGESVVCGPDGDELARARDGDELLVADLDPDVLAAARSALPYLVDRRPELYRAIAPIALDDGEGENRHGKC